MGKFKPPQLAPRPGGLKSNVEEHPVARPQVLEKCSTGHSASLGNGSKYRTPLTEICGRSAGNAGSQFYKMLYTKRNANKVSPPLFIILTRKKMYIGEQSVQPGWSRAIVWPQDQHHGVGIHDIRILSMIQLRFNDAQSERNFQTRRSIATYVPLSRLDARTLLRQHISDYDHLLWNATDVCRLHRWTVGIWLQDMMPHLNDWSVIQYSHNRVWPACWFLLNFEKCLSQWIIVSLNDLSLQKRKNKTFADGVLEVKPDAACILYSEVRLSPSGLLVGTYVSHWRHRRPWHLQRMFERSLLQRMVSACPFNASQSSHAL